MTLYVLNPGIQPLGDFDLLDTDLTNVAGGECGTLDEASRTSSSTEAAAADVYDGYVADQIDVGTPDASRPVVRRADSTTETYKVFYLLDDGTTGYGTLFGQQIGGNAGQATTGTNLGPRTHYASGKVTCWANPGLYAVSLDNVYDNTSNQNQRLASGADTPLPGEVLYRWTGTGQIGRPTTSGDKICLFVEMAANQSLVNTPARLVGATTTYDRIVIQYLGATFNA